ncbi:hypothetical protein SBP1_gp027 [Vibrio virus vB_VspP_SBP1]|uniref:Uncharacterized protein n=1 Tax=Vibrio virus vB_VspP_SBP1 TaxID=2500581 RepID=A0A3T0IIM4_9CAUD|nr:hypothetical protein KNU36_gp102 [Vibrio virus vB_VspP_SBP1]AZU99619.1 hypothetical protein SBP1_gp027 [Vibrio virus vB_VspP_SBP1]
MDKIENLEEGLKLIGLLTPESREKIVTAFKLLEIENLQLKAEVNTLRGNLEKLEDRMDRVQHYLTNAGQKY